MADVIAANAPLVVRASKQMVYDGQAAMGMERALEASAERLPGRERQRGREGGLRRPRRRSATRLARRVSGGPGGAAWISSMTMLHTDRLGWPARARIARAADELGF